jgi:hypothetical protein
MLVCSEGKTSGENREKAELGFELGPTKQQSSSLPTERSAPSEIASLFEDKNVSWEYWVNNYYLIMKSLLHVRVPQLTSSFLLDRY